MQVRCLENWQLSKQRGNDVAPSSYLSSNPALQRTCTARSEISGTTTPAREFLECNAEAGNGSRTCRVHEYLALEHLASTLRVAVFNFKRVSVAGLAFACPVMGLLTRSHSQCQ